MKKESALQYLPQRSPFIMVDNILFCDDKRCQTEFAVTAENILVSNNCLLEAGVIENIAQTCAARIGYIGIHYRQEKVKIGVIGAIKNFVLYRKPRVGERLYTEVEEIMNGFYNMTVLNSIVVVGDETIAQCEMKVALID